MSETDEASAFVFVCACRKATPSDGNENTPVVTNYATEILSLPATSRDHWQIYQVNPKLYGNSGAFGKIQARLDDIKALGTDFFYLMPIYAEGKKNAIGSPYCIRNFKEVNGSYGTLNELKFSAYQFQVWE